MHIYDSFFFYAVDAYILKVVNATQSSIHDNKIYKFITATPEK